jgi:hypothetical protein
MSYGIDSAIRDADMADPETTQIDREQTETSRIRKWTDG